MLNKQTKQTMTELTKEQKIYVINEMIRYYKKEKHICVGMCFLMRNIIYQDLKHRDGLNYYENEFMMPEFFLMSPKINYKIGYWFRFAESAPRLAYCKKIKLLLEGK